MNKFRAKLKLIFLPFIIIAFAVVISYTFLNWLLLIQLHLFKIDEDTVNYWIPIIIPGIPLLIWFRQRVKLLKLNTTGRKDPVTLFMMLAWATIAISSIIAQQYIVTATGKLTVLSNIRDIDSLPPTKYYKVGQFYINKNFSHGKVTYGVSGRHNEYFDMSIYLCTPVFDHLFPDTTKITQIREHVNPEALVIINDSLQTMWTLKRLPADSIRYMNYVNPSFIMPKYGDAGKYGAILVVTKGYKNM